MESKFRTEGRDESTMNWHCASCGWKARTNRQKCPNCGNLIWKPVPKKDLTELSGPLKQIAPRGLLLANPGKQAKVEESNGIECGTCHTVIYRPDKGFDAEALEDARKTHYSTSPTCKGHK